MHAPPTAPTAQGSLAKTPFPHLLVYALERALTGTFELMIGGQPVATMLVIQGVPAKVRTTDGLHRLGDVLTELGLVSSDAIKAAQPRMAEAPRLLGQVLAELGAVDEARLDVGVRAQLDRKVEHLFALPPQAQFAYYDGLDTLAQFGGAPTPIDPLPALWRGIRQAPSWEHVEATLKRVGTSTVRIAAKAQLDRFQFGRIEIGAIEMLRQRPMPVASLVSAKVVGPSVAQLLIYVLVITRQVDVLEAPTGRQAAVGPASAPGSRSPATLGGGPAPPSAQTGTPAGQAFARVQLQAKAQVRAPLIVEEAPIARNAMDGRIASPLPQPIPLGLEGATGTATQDIDPAIPMAPPAPVIAGISPVANPARGASGLDIGAMISTAISASMPPGPQVPGPPDSSRSVGAPPPSSAAESAPPAPSAPGAAADLTPEQAALRDKIVERAAQISSQDYFQMLGVARDAPADAVQNAFFGLAKVWHPDRLPAVLADVRDACSKVFTHLTEAHATLCDATRREEYMTLLKDGGATPDDQAMIQAIVEAATDFQKAEFYLKRHDLAQAHEAATRALSLDPEQLDYLAMVAWLDAQKPEWLGREKTLEKIAILDACVSKNPNSERAHFWRGMLYKRIDEAGRALKDFKRAADLNPRNLDAMREVRLSNMRGGGSKPPPASHANRAPSKPPSGDKLGGLFGKLFKK